MKLKIRHEDNQEITYKERERERDSHQHEVNHMKVGTQKYTIMSEQKGKSKGIILKK